MSKELPPNFDDVPGRKAGPLGSIKYQFLSSAMNAKASLCPWKYDACVDVTLTQIVEAECFRELASGKQQTGLN